VDVHIAHDHVVSLEQKSGVDLSCLRVSMKDSLFNDGIRMAVKLIKGALRHILADAGP